MDDRTWIDRFVQGGRHPARPVNRRDACLPESTIQKMLHVASKYLVLLYLVMTYPSYREFQQFIISFQTLKG
jgi:hypothetical protein